MPLIRTTFRPDIEIEVSEHEESVLRHQKLVVDTKATTAEGAIRAAERQNAQGSAQNEES